MADLSTHPIAAQTLDGHKISVTVTDGTIRSVEPLEIPASDPLPWIAPGLIDLQVNGYAGTDYNVWPLDPEALHQSAIALRQTGVTGFLPTIVTNSARRVEDLLDSFSAALEQNHDLRELVLGFHLEGPFISSEKGARGAHPAEHVIPHDLDLVKRWQDAARGELRLLTMAPEWPGSPAFIATCVEMGIRVAIGHTVATGRQISEAVTAGATLSTHLGNACPQFLHRHDNLIWQQLAEDDLWASVIADGFHLPGPVLKTILTAKRSQAILISDTTCFGGMNPGRYQTHIGGEVVLDPSGRLAIAGDDEYLAGSALPVIRGVENLVAAGYADLPCAWALASSAPAAFLDLPDRGRLAPGNRADLVTFRVADGRFAIERVLVGTENADPGHSLP